MKDGNGSDAPPLLLPTHVDLYVMKGLSLGLNTSDSQTHPVKCCWAYSCVVIQTWAGYNIVMLLLCELFVMTGTCFDLEHFKLPSP